MWTRLWLWPGGSSSSCLYYFDTNWKNASRFSKGQLKSLNEVAETSAWLSAIPSALASLCLWFINHFTKLYTKSDLQRNFEFKANKIRYRYAAALLRFTFAKNSPCPLPPYFANQLKTLSSWPLRGVSEWQGEAELLLLLFQVSL